jgi:Tol biopolymer transport system component
MEPQTLASRGFFAPTHAHPPPITGAMLGGGQPECIKAPGRLGWKFAGLTCCRETSCIFYYLTRFLLLLAVIASVSTAAGCGESHEHKELRGIAKHLAETLTRLDFCPTWSPDGKSLVYPSRARPENIDSPFSVDGGFLTVIDADGTNRHELQNRLLGDDPDWSPDGKRIVFIREEPILNSGTGELDVVNPDGSRRRSIVAVDTPNSFNDSPKWSPDGTKLVYVHWVSDDTPLDPSDDDPGASGPPLVVVNADGRAPRPLSGTVFRNADEPDWAPDGRRLVFNDGQGLAIANLDGTGFRRIVESPAGEPSWSPDGGRIVFVGGEDPLSTDLFIFGASNGTTTPLTTISDTGAFDSCPEWSPDGSRIAFLRTIERKEGTPKTFGTPEDATSFWSALFVINPDGTGERQVTQTTASNR